jgi:hypothetical protein
MLTDENPSAALDNESIASVCLPRTDALATRSREAIGCDQRIFAFAMLRVMRSATRRQRARCNIDLSCNAISSGLDLVGHYDDAAIKPLGNRAIAC